MTTSQKSIQGFKFFTPQIVAAPLKQVIPGHDSGPLDALIAAVVVPPLTMIAPHPQSALISVAVVHFSVQYRGAEVPVIS